MAFIDAFRPHRLFITRCKCGLHEQERQHTRVTAFVPGLFDRLRQKGARIGLLKFRLAVADRAGDGREVEAWLEGEALRPRSWRLRLEYDEAQRGAVMAISSVPGQAMSLPDATSRSGDARRPIRIGHRYLHAAAV